MNLEETLAQMKKQTSEKLPAEKLAIMKKATEELTRSGKADRALKAGDRAPDFTLPNHDGRPVALRDLLAPGPLVLTFYRGLW